MRRSSALLALACLAASGSICATERMFGQLIMQSTDPAHFGEVQILTKDSPSALVPAVLPGNGTLLRDWDELDALPVPTGRAAFQMEKVSLPSPGDTGPVENFAGFCLTRGLEVEWAACDGGDRQRWTHRDHALWAQVGSRVGYLGFAPGTPRGGRWVLLDGSSGVAPVVLFQPALHYDHELTGF